MTFDQIMQNITSGLTGDGAADTAYLMEQMENYKDHELGKEIIRACGRLMYDIIPDDIRAELDKDVHNTTLGWDAILDEARFNQANKNYDKALQLLQPLVVKVDRVLASGMYSEDSVSQYFSFDNFFERLLYMYYNKPQKMLRDPGSIPISSIYANYGSVLIDLNRIEEAQIALAKAVAWNPASCNITFEYIDLFKRTQDLDTFLALTLGSFKYIYSFNFLGRAYRNLGYYFVEKEMWDEAVACYILSMQFDNESNHASSELYYISQVTGKKITPPDNEYVFSLADKYGFPIGPDGDVIGLAYTIGMQCIKENNADTGKELLQIAYNLTQDDEIKVILEKL